MLRTLTILALAACILFLILVTHSDASVPVHKACPAGHITRCRGEIIRLRRAVAWQRQRAAERWPGDAAAAIVLACHVRGVSKGSCAAAFRVARCESLMDPGARNRSSSAKGLFQFLDGTWTRSGFPAWSVFDPYVNAYAALRLVERDGGWREWSCGFAA